MTDLASRVKLLCDAAGTSREHLSRLCGLTPSHIGLMVAGRNQNVRGDVAARIAKVFGCSLEWLITGEGPPPTVVAVKAAVAAAEPPAAREPEEEPSEGAA